MTMLDPSSRRLRVPLRFRWRTLECWAAGLAILLQTGVIFALLLEAQYGSLDESVRAKLRILSLPVYPISLMILARHPRATLVALRRSLPLLVLVGLCVASLAWSISPSVTLRRAFGLFGSLMLAYALAIRFTPRQLLVLVAAVFGICMVLSLLAIVTMPGLTIGASGDVRGAFQNKNSFGWAAALATLTAGLVAYDRSLGLRPMGLLFFGLGLACVLASTSATSLLSAAAGCAFLWFYRRLARTRGTARVVFVLLFVQAAIGLLLLEQAFLGPTLEALGKDATLTGRVPLWEKVDVAIARRFILGYGYGAFWTPGSPDAWQIWSESQWQAPHSHNGFRDTFLSLGLVGAVALAVVLARALLQGARLLCAQPENGWLWMNVWLGMFLVMNFTESLILAQNDVYWTLVMAVVISIGLRASVRLNESSTLLPPLDESRLRPLVP